jgi:SAM-dependent methyltransferase
VLDVGAADGSVARALSERGCTIWAIEQDPPSAEAAGAVCERVLCADLEGPEVWTSLRGESFNAVLALDVLEHLRDPHTVLQKLSKLLTPDGIVVVSIPNITHGAMRLHLLEGRFEYANLGLLDRTHLRFFDRRGAERLMTEAGLEIVDRLRVSRAFDATELVVNTESVPADVLERIAQDPDSTTYQFVFVARSAREREHSHDISESLSTRLLSELEALRRRFAELETHTRSLAADRERRIDEETRLQDYSAQLVSELEATRRRFAELETYTKSLDGDVRRRLDEETRLHHYSTQLVSELEATRRRFAELETHTRNLGADRERLLEDEARYLRNGTTLTHERDELRNELTERMEELRQKHLELRHCKADLVVKEAFITSLRTELAVRGNSGTQEIPDPTTRPLTPAGSSVERLQEEVVALRVYANSAGFRLVERGISALRRVPLLFSATQRAVRYLAGGSHANPREAPDRTKNP